MIGPFSILLADAAAGPRGSDRVVECAERIEAAGGENLTLAGNDLGAGADDDGDVRLNTRIAGLADGEDAPLLEADIGLHDPPIVEDQRVGDDGIDRALGIRRLALAHAVADHLAAAEFHLLAI